VVRTRVGYAGGTTSSPTYRNMGDHTETVQIDYDPSKTTYEKLLDTFWTGHDPTHRGWYRQYASIIFVHDEEQLRLAEASKIRLAKERNSTIHTDIVRFKEFTLAENYHQKHSLQQFPQFQEELKQIYPVPSEYVASTAVARVNGYLGGEGSFEDLLKEIEGFGLSTARKEELQKLVLRHQSGQACPLPANRTTLNAR
jgi:peptide-methionine (S)-S-oxide reductase